MIIELDEMSLRNIKTGIRWIKEWTKEIESVLQELESKQMKERDAQFENVPKGAINAISTCPACENGSTIKQHNHC